MPKTRTSPSMLGYGGCEVMQDQVAGPDGEPMQASFVRFLTVQAQPGGKTTTGAGPWIFFTTEALEDLARQLTEIASTIKRIEAGEDPEKISHGEGVTMTRLPDKPFN